MMIRHALRHLTMATAAVAALATCTSALAFTPPPFPRLAGVNFGNPFDYNDSNYQAELARLSVDVIADYPGMKPGGESLDSIVQAIKAINPSTLVFLYVQSDYLNPSASNDAWTTLRNKINSMQWWLYTDTSFSTMVAGSSGPPNYTINNTPYTPKDSSGEDSVDWITNYLVQNIYQPNSAVDGLFMDNVLVQPMVSGDWYRDGTSLSPSSPQAQAALQAGYERYFSLVHRLIPGKYELGNIAEWGQKGPVPSGYVNMAEGGLLETIIGESWSTETWAGWQAMMTQYSRAMAALNAPKLLIFNQYGSPTDYRSFRYGFASCLMNDGYYSFTDPSQGYTGLVWFDEYNAKLGQATTPPPTAAWQNGVWRRDFTDGIALVNPKGNGPRTVQLGGTFVKINGSQDPSVNNGQTVTSVTLQDRDGIILMRQTPLEQPKAPTGLTVTGGS